MENLDSFAKETDNVDFFHKIKAPESGLVVYYTDGYERFTENELDPELFEKAGNSSKNLQTDSIINVNDPAYKLITSDTWYIYIQLDETQAARLADSKSVNISFADDDINCRAGFEIINVGGASYGKIKMTKYLPGFSTKRYVTVELEQQTITGLKIPSSSIYYSDKDNYYVSMKDFQSGQIITIADSQEVFTVGIIQELDGVYCVNRGYAVFKAVTVIDKNSEYCIIEKGTDYGLATYDHIVLDYRTVKESELIE